MLLPRQRSMLARGAKDKEHTMSQNFNDAIAVIGSTATYWPAALRPGHATYLVVNGSKIWDPSA